MIVCLRKVKQFKKVSLGVGAIIQAIVSFAQNSCVRAPSVPQKIMD